MNYPKKTGFNLYQSRHCAYMTYSVKTWFFKILSVSKIKELTKAFKTFRVCINHEMHKNVPVISVSLIFHGVGGQMSKFEMKCKVNLQEQQKIQFRPLLLKIFFCVFFHVSYCDMDL